MRSTSKGGSFFLILVSSISFPLFGLVGLARGSEINILMAVRETIDTHLLDTVINVEMGATDQQLQRNLSGKYPFKSNVSAKDNPILKIQITPNADYKVREILIPASTLLTNNNTSYDFYLAKSNPALTYAYLDNGIRFHTREFDKAFAYYDVAFSNRVQGNQVTQFDIKLNYNYAVSVANTCLRLGYATCNDARELYQKLKEDAKQYRNWFDKEKINLAQLDSTLSELSSVEVNMQYKTFKTLLEKKKYIAAADVATDLLEKFDAGKEGFSGARLSKDRLLEDIGVTYVKASTAGSTGDAEPINSKDLLQKAHSYYSKISVKSPQLTRDINYLEKIKE